MILFRVFLVLLLIAATGLTIWRLRRQPERLQRLREWLRRQRLWPGSSLRERETLLAWLYLWALLLFTVLALSGFLPVLFGAPMSGILLLLHMAAAPLFAIVLLLLLLLTAELNRMADADWQALATVQNGAAERTAKQWAYRKLCFWGIALISAVVLLSITLSFFSLLGTEGQHAALDIHRYASAVLALLVLLQIYLLAASTEPARRQTSGGRRKRAA